MIAQQDLGAAERSARRPGDDAATRSPLMPLVLVVEDDARMRKYLRNVFVDQNFRVMDVETGGEALVEAASHRPDLVVLDFGLPDIDGIHVVTKLREQTPAPILILSAHDEEGNKVAALDAGANDFQTKPFGTGEFLARVRMWLRQMQRPDWDGKPAVLEVGRLRLDLERRLAFVDGVELRLTPTQYKLLALMMRNTGKVLTHEQILTAVWGAAYIKETQYLRVYMNKLRQKIEKDPSRPEYLITELGIGYRLSASPRVEAVSA